MVTRGKPCLLSSESLSLWIAGYLGVNANTSPSRFESCPILSDYGLYAGRENGRIFTRTVEDSSQ